MAEEAIKRYTAPQILLAVAAFLTPLIGGQISTDQSLPLPPGFGSLLAAMLGGPFTEGFETPLLSHFTLGILIALAMAISLLQRAVIQLPNIKLTGLMIGFFGLLFISVGLSTFRSASISMLGEWLLYALAFFTAVEVLGRKHGPRLMLSALFVGVCIVALYGIGVEYQQMRAIDPSYRIFGGWVNPNATAGIFLIGLTVGMGLMPSFERGAALLTGVGCVLISAALFLTGSKAGFGAAIVAAVVFAVLAVAWSSDAKVKLQRAGLALLTLVIGFGLFTAIQKANQPASAGGQGSSLGRIATYGDTQAQSLGFRKLLWKGSLNLSLKHPTGYGLGTYRYEGSREGLTTQTQLAHNNVLQIAVESSWLGVLFLMGALLLWLSLMFRGARSMPEETNMARAGIVAALIGTFAHGIFESNLYYFGIGLTFFMLMGVGLTLSADSVAPEFTPKGARSGLALLALIPVGILAYYGWAEYQRAQIRYALQTKDIDGARALTTSLVSFSPSDGEAWNTLHFLDPDRREEAINRAAAVSPSPRILRNLAKFYQGQKKFSSAESAINDALSRDPNNLNTLKLALEVCQDAGDQNKAKVYAERMLGVEKTPYFQIRSLPQMVETSTSDARIYLAGLAQQPKQKAELLQGALDFLTQYAETTVPEVMKMGGDFGGESVEKATQKCQQGVQVAKELEKLYRLMGETDKSTEAGGKVGLFESALESLAGGNK
jgi:O-antigen ligase